MQQQLDYSAHLDSSILEAVGAAGDAPEGLDPRTDDPQILNQRLLKEIHQNSKLRRELADLNKQVDFYSGKLDDHVIKVQELEELLKDEKRNSEVVQIDAATLLEQCRIRAESAVEAQRDLEKVIVLLITQGNQCRRKLEKLGKLVS